MDLRHYGVQYSYSRRSLSVSCVGGLAYWQYSCDRRALLCMASSPCVPPPNPRARYTRPRHPCFAWRRPHACQLWPQLSVWACKAGQGFRIQIRRSKNPINPNPKVQESYKSKSKGPRILQIQIQTSKNPTNPNPKVQESLQNPKKTLHYTLQLLRMVPVCYDSLF